MQWGVLAIALAQLVGLPAAAADPAGDLAKLSDHALVESYRSEGLALADTAHAPNYMGGPASAVDWDRRKPFDRTRAEIGRRGKPVVPGLLGLLREEVVTTRPPDKNGIVVSLTWDALELLVAIGDPQAVPVVAELLNGMGGRASIQARNGAINAIERLTFCSMRKLRPYMRYSEKSVPHPTGIDKESLDLDTAARLYRVWLAGEGSDPSRWLALARQRALKALRGDDPDAIYCAADFLFDRGFDAEEVVRRLAEVLDELKPRPRGSSTYRGKVAAMSVGSWARDVARYGPLARPYAKLLILLQKERGENAWGYYAMLREVGGDEVMAHLFGVLPRISAEVAKLRADPGTPRGFSGSDPRGWWFDSLREVQLACDRWAGRRFNTDAERVAWWKANRGRAREAWLAVNLETVVYQADAGDVWAGWVAGEILPDLPRFAPKGYPAHHAAAFRTKWLRDHRWRLKYDSKAEVFRLRVEEN